MSPELQTAYHLMLDCEQLRTPLLDAQMALVALHLCAQEREAWTDVGADGVVRASDLTQSDKKRQI